MHAFEPSACWICRYGGVSHFTARDGLTNPALVADSLFESPVIDAAAVMRICGISRPAAGEVVKRLEQLGVVSRVPGLGRPRKYWSQDIIAIAGGAPGESEGCLRVAIALSESGWPDVPSKIVS